MPFRILSLDGGGIRGLLAAAILQRLEALTGRPARDLFDLIVGTSTGGILAVGLCVADAAGRPRLSASQLLDLYLDEGPLIFSRSWWYRLRSVDGLINAKYPATGLERVLERYFADARLRDLIGHVMVTAYETKIRQPWFFRSRRAREDAGYDFLARDVARATSAAPTVFPPSRVTATDGRSWTLVDGGIFANNPTMCGIVEAMAIHDADDMITVSLGTGKVTRPLPYGRIRSWGLARWARPAFDMVLDGVSESVDYQAGQLSRSVGEVAGHIRMQVELAAANDDFDDASPANVAALIGIAEQVVDDRASELERLADALVS